MILFYIDNVILMVQKHADVSVSDRFDAAIKLHPVCDLVLKLYKDSYKVMKKERERYEVMKK